MSDHTNPCPACVAACQSCTYECAECGRYYGSRLAAKECAGFDVGATD